MYEALLTLLGTYAARLRHLQWFAKLTRPNDGKLTSLLDLLDRPAIETLQPRSVCI
jgi:hypothetical protein